MTGELMLVLYAAAAMSALVATQPGSPGKAGQPGRDPELLHRQIAELVTAREAEQEGSLRKLLALGGAEAGQAEVTARLASVLRAHGLSLALRAQSEEDEGKGAAAGLDKARATQARTEAVARYRELLARYPRAPRQDEALFFLADTLQDSGKDDEAVEAARTLVSRFPSSKWAPASHVFIGEHLFDASKLAAALAEYRAAAKVPSDEIFPYALYKAAWCRFNQSAFSDAEALLHQVVEVSLGGDATQPIEGTGSKVQLAREARRDFVLVYSRAGKPEAAREEFARRFGKDSGLRMLELYATLLFDGGRDPEAQLIERELLALHGDAPLAALDQTRLLVIAARGGKRRELLHEAAALVETFRRVESGLSVRDQSKAAIADREKLDEARRLAEETLRGLAVQTHNEAKKTELPDTYAAAKALYTDYLALFPDAADAYDLRYFDGELLSSLGDDVEAAARYEAVVRQDLAARKEKRHEGRWLAKAAWSAVLSRDQATQPTSQAAQAKRLAQPKRGQQPKAAAPARPDSRQRPLTADEKLLAASCALYLEALPDGPHAVEVSFKLGRLDYVAGDLAGAEQQLSWLAQTHPESELAEFAANLVLDIGNLRHDWASVHAWALKFLAVKRLTAQGTLLADLRRIEEESDYALADETAGDAAKATALLAFVEQHPHGALADKALFGAAAALSRAGRIDDALAARARLWKEQGSSPLVPRALFASASDRAALGDFGEAASLLERYANQYRRQEETQRWRRAHPLPRGQARPAQGPLFEEEKARTGLRDAATLREARGELRLALADRTLALQLWKNGASNDADEETVALLRAKIGEPQRAARELVALAQRAHGKPALRISAWRDAARLLARAHQTVEGQRAWADLEREFHSLGPKAREALPREALAAAAEAHLALGAKAFEEFKQQRIEPPLLRTLNRKIGLLKAVQRRAEETVSMREAEPAVCALVQIGEAQLLLAQGIAKSPVPRELTSEQRKLYREAIDEKAQPLYAESRATLQDAQERARSLFVSGACVAKTVLLLEKLGVKSEPAPKLELLSEPLAPAPPFLDAEGKPASTKAGKEESAPQDEKPEGPRAVSTMDATAAAATATQIGREEER